MGPLSTTSFQFRNQYNQCFTDSNIFFSLSAILSLLYQDHSQFLCNGGGLGCKRIDMLRKFEELSSKRYVISSKGFLPPFVPSLLSGLKNRSGCLFSLLSFFLSFWDRLYSFAFHAVMIHWLIETLLSSTVSRTTVIAAFCCCQLMGTSLPFNKVLICPILL